MRWLILVLIILSFSTFMDAKVIHVPGDYPLIQQGIDNAVNSDTVLVADGIYTGVGNKNLDFMGKAITVMSQHGAYSTIINCENNGRGFYFKNGETEESILQGFTIQNGDTSFYGGGIFCDSSPIIKNCIVKENNAGLGGGGICCRRSFPLISECKIINNRDGLRGGGIYCEYASPRIFSCIISGNSAISIGGAIFSNEGSPFIDNCLIINNSTSDKEGKGGAIGFSSYRTPTAPVLSNSTITGNRNDGKWSIGGAIHSFFDTDLIISNCYITDNYSKSNGGGMFLDDT